MLLSKILTPKPKSALKALLCGALALLFALPAPAQGKSDDVLLDMQQAFRKGDKKRLSALLPQARGHVLEPWAAYWELKGISTPTGCARPAARARHPPGDRIALPRSDSPLAGDAARSLGRPRRAR